MAEVLSVVASGIAVTQAVQSSDLGLGGVLLDSAVEGGERCRMSLKWLVNWPPQSRLS